MTVASDSEQGPGEEQGPGKDHDASEEPSAAEEAAEERKQRRLLRELALRALI